MTNLQKMTGKNPKLDLVNINAHTKFGQILSISSQDIGRKRNFEGNSDKFVKGCNSVTNVEKYDMLQSQSRSCQYQCIYKKRFNSVNVFSRY